MSRCDRGPRSAWAAHVQVALLLTLPAAWTACAGDKGDGSARRHGGGADSGGEEVSGDPRGEDEALLRAAIAGAVNSAQALRTVAARSGLPLETATGGYLFACLCGDGAWSLAGDHDDWAGAPMALAGDLSWIEVGIPDPDGSLYKFTDGDTWKSDPQGRRFGWDDNGEHSLVTASSAHLERWYSLEGYALRPRDAQVWVPEDAQFTHALYAHDGQNLFDPGAMWGGWRLSDSLPPAVLVVGLDNTADRMEEYTHTEDLLDGDVYGGDAEAYAQLVEEVVRPTMEAAYGPATVTGTMGSSLGGLVSFFIAHEYEGRYDMAISLSGTMGWGSIGAENPTIIDLYAAAGHRSTALYLDSGGGGSTCADEDGDGTNDDDLDSSDNYCENLQLRDTLAEAGYTYDVDLWHWWEPGATHDELAWADRVWRPLALFAALE